MEKRLDPRKKDGEKLSDNVVDQESNKSLRLFRSAVQTAQRLDIQLKSSNAWQDVFSPDIVLRRQRLRENCEHLLFTYPDEYGRKAEELLWRKVFYDLIQKLKQFRKKGDEDTELCCAYRSHLSSATSFYFHLLVSFQNVCDLNFQGYFDWIPVSSSLDRIGDKAKTKNNEWVLKACQRILIYLGDLARYQQEFDGDLSTELAERFYHQAIYLNPDLGMPHNQLGTLFWSHNYGCRAAYYYMRCLMSGSPFEGTEGNLLRLFEENHSHLQQLQQSLVAEMAESKVRLTATSRFLTQFLYLQEIFYKSISLPAKDYQRLCNFILHELDMALNHTHDTQTKNHKGGGANNISVKKDAKKDGQKQKEGSDEKVDGDLLEGRTLLEMEALLIMSVTRMKIKSSALLQDAFSFFMKFIAEIIRHCVSNMEVARSADVGLKLAHQGSNGLVQNGFISRDTKDKESYEEDERVAKAKQLKKRLLTQRRRRRRHSSTLSDSDGESDSGGELGESALDESDLSEGELDELLNETVSGDEDESNASSLSGDEMKPGKRSENVLVNGGSKSAHSRGHEHHHLLTNLVKEDLLMVIKLCVDWLRVNPEVTKCEDSIAMFTQLAEFLNILPKQDELWRIANLKGNILKDTVDENVNKNWVQSKALREDIALLGFTPLAELHGRLDISWNKNIKFRKLLETVVRLQSIKAGAAFLASFESQCLEYDSSSGVFSVSKHSATNGEATNASTKEDNQRRAKLMKTMAQQRLQSEVADLESKVKSQSSSPSPYLIPDAPTLCTQLHIIRQLIATRNFVVIVPIQVISALDELKKFNPGAREAIKYLEQELKKGNRWIRAQKESETVSRAQKRGKQEEISVWRFSQVVNCCLHFIEQSASGMVTLLTDDSDIDFLKKRPSRGNAAIAVGTKASPQAVELAMKNKVNVQSIKSFRAKWVGKNSVT